MIHGCRLGEGTVVEPAAIVCDWSVVGAESVVRAGACVKQRADFPARSVLDGFPARLVGTLDAPPPLPAWALPREHVGTIARLH
jgi:carbonic anhydrase/acetyltransferase-like protein (isoleucine patch superfamily)